MKIEEKDEDGKDVKEQSDVWGWEGRMRNGRMNEDVKKWWGWRLEGWKLEGRMDRMDRMDMNIKKWIWMIKDGYEW